MGYRSALSVIVCLPAALWGAAPDAWVPARWTGGPLELERRAAAKTLPGDAAAREAIAGWHDPATLNLLEGTPVNCLLVTWSAGGNAALERRQHEALKPFIERARQRGMALLGLVYPGGDPSRIVTAAADARLDGLVLEGEFPEDFTGRITTALAAANPAAVVIPVARDGAGPVIAVEGVSPSARSLAEMGIRAGPSSEPWIESNIWLARALRDSPSPRPVWISYEPDHGSAIDYARSVADAAAAGGRWIVTLDDGLRTKLRRNDPAALEIWRSIGKHLRFAEKNAGWRAFRPYGNFAFILGNDESGDEYLKLVARRQVPCRILPRSAISGPSLAAFRAVLATSLDPPTDPERNALRAFAENGGVVIAGPSWGGASNDRPFTDLETGKGRITIYRDLDPETIARDMKELSVAESGMIPFNVPSVLTQLARSGDGKRVLVQLVNYSNSPATSITLRLAGKFRTARLEQPDAAPSELAVTVEEGHTDVEVPKLALWAGVVLE